MKSEYQQPDNSEEEYKSVRKEPTFLQKTLDYFIGFGIPDNMKYGPLEEYHREFFDGEERTKRLNNASKKRRNIIIEKNLLTLVDLGIIIASAYTLEPFVLIPLVNSEIMRFTIHGIEKESLEKQMKEKGEFVKKLISGRKEGKAE